MTDRRLLAPWFLDRRSEPVLRLARPGDGRIAAAPGPGDQTESLAPIHLAIADGVRGALAAGERPVAVLGDCCQTIGVLAGLQHGGLAPSLVWIDAHGDFNTWETTPSGFLGGMPLAMITGRGDQRMMEAVGLSPLADGRVVLSDGRDLDPGERELVRSSRLRHVDGLANLPAALPAGPLYVHFDSEVIDSREAPAFLYPVPGGPSAEATRAILAAIAATGRVVAVSATVGWDVGKDAAGRTEAAVRHAFGALVA